MFKARGQSRLATRFSFKYRRFGSSAPWALAIRQHASAGRHSLLASVARTRLLAFQIQPIIHGPQFVSGREPAADTDSPKTKKPPSGSRQLRLQQELESTSTR